ncbi:MAG TPA: beta-N-acetylhexosaminidase [Candidatus Solibacter sp.]|nr:beta-N-acetylhexosaminidase [Candidatus Solibacter sp.]
MTNGFPSAFLKLVGARHRSLRLLGAGIVLCSVAARSQAAQPLVFPLPQEITAGGARFTIGDRTAILIPSHETPGDLALARQLADELNDRFGAVVSIRRTDSASSLASAIVLGSIANPLVEKYCSEKHIAVTPRDPGPAGYVLHADGDLLLIAGSDDTGAFHGLQSLRQLIARTADGLGVPGVRIRDWPSKPFRGIKLYLPGRDNIPFFKRFVRDFMALYKYNKLIMEVDASMRLDRHPELNAGWLEFARDTNYSRRNYPPGPPRMLRQNSSHQDVADGGFLEKAEVADLVQWAEANYIEVIPEIPSFTHSYYLLSKHRELSEVPGEKWPDTFCPSNPKSYQLLFEVFDEYIEVMHPKMVHVGHDEWFAPLGQCELCRGKDPGELYAQDLRKTHDYLAGKGIQMAVWGDVLLESVRGKGARQTKTRDGWTYDAPGAMTPEQVKNLVPKDILIFNWFWSGNAARSAPREAQLEDFGFQEIWGNLETRLAGFETRIKRQSILGGAPSSWEATNEFNFGKDLIRDYLGAASMLWSGKMLEAKELTRTGQAMMPGVRERLHGHAPPSGYGDQIAPLDISAAYNMPGSGLALGVDLGGVGGGLAHSGPIPFDLGPRGAVIVGAEGVGKNPLPREVTVKIGEDATSLIFLHAAARAATNKLAYRLLWDMEDSADLLGFYEVVYEDGLVADVPIRYGVNILEWNWDRVATANGLCYGADAVPAGNTAEPVTFWAFEWPNPRLGKVIREVRLKGTTGFRGAVPGFEDEFGPVIPSNAVVLKSISLVKKR